ncbi:MULTISPECIES: hypothetical protein [unclassified Nostoc]|uniref:hypothetical protein n=1 Tax=unclassified Nostoc TaxID=2593658 RepID=UPI002AD43741|nr:hypothetical protein [Nostoc sp. ChiQUE02]MDZ8232398.1 hypothetical protein [Nostoc sp. ChiQUE02]
MQLKTAINLTKPPLEVECKGNYFCWIWIVAKFGDSIKIPFCGFIGRKFFFNFSAIVVFRSQGALPHRLGSA